MSFVAHNSGCVGVKLGGFQWTERHVAFNQMCEKALDDLQVVTGGEACDRAVELYSMLQDVGSPFPKVFRLGRAVHGDYTLMVSREQDEGGIWRLQDKFSGARGSHSYTGEAVFS